MAAFQQQLQTRRAQLGAWREGLTAFLQVGDRTPAAVEARAGAVWDLLELGPADRLQSLAVGGRTLRLEGRDPCMQRLTHMAVFLARCLGSEREGEGEGVVEWAGKPAVAALAELHKRGRELGAARHELRGLARALRACQGAADGAKRLLPEGVTKQGHLRLKQKGSGGGARGGGGRKEARRRTGGGAIAGTTSATEAAAAATPGTLGLEALMALIAALLNFPYRLDRELAAAFRLLGAVTRARRRSWELLGVRVGEEFAVLDALLRQAARRLFPQLRAELEAGGPVAVSPLGAGAELEGAPRFYPQGIAPGAASGGGDGAATVVSSASASGGGGKKRKGQERAYRMVKGRWEGRRFAFLPGPNVWLGVERLSKELRLLGVACPEWELLVDRGNLVLSEDLGSEKEEDGGGKKRQKRVGSGKSEKRAPGRKKGWCTALPFAVGKAQAAARGPRKAKAKVAEAAPGFVLESSSPLALEAAEGKSGSGAGAGGGGDAAMVVG